VLNRDGKAIHIADVSYHCWWSQGIHAGGFFTGQYYPFQWTVLLQTFYTDLYTLSPSSNLVPANGRWCLAAGKVTAGLASHWPRVTDISGSPPTGSRPWRGRWAPAYALLWSIVDFTFTLYIHWPRQRNTHTANWKQTILQQQMFIIGIQYIFWKKNHS